MSVTLGILLVWVFISWGLCMYPSACPLPSTTFWIYSSLSKKYCFTSILGELYLKHKSNLSPQLSALEQSERGVELGSTGLFSTVGSIMAAHFFLSLSDPPNLVSSSDFNWAPMGPVTICSVDGELKRSVKQRGSIEHVAGGCHTDIGFEILKSPQTF